jgi:hypothetical protein
VKGEWWLAEHSVFGYGNRSGRFLRGGARFVLNAESIGRGTDRPLLPAQVGLALLHPGDRPVTDQ